MLPSKDSEPLLIGIHDARLCFCILIISIWLVGILDTDVSVEISFTYVL